MHKVLEAVIRHFAVHSGTALALVELSVGTSASSPSISEAMPDDL
jgi:hypothetical protein